MTKIITTTDIDFVRAEIDEWGFTYVDDMFANGYQPTQINGVWCWDKAGDDNVLRVLQSDNGDSHSRCHVLHHNRNHLPLMSLS